MYHGFMGTVSVYKVKNLGDGRWCTLPNNVNLYLMPLNCTVKYGSITVKKHLKNTYIKKEKKECTVNSFALQRGREEEGVGIKPF